MNYETSLKALFGGTLLVVIGTAMGMGFEFLTRLLIIRNSSPAEYGLFALGYAVLLGNNPDCDPWFPLKGCPGRQPIFLEREGRQRP